MWCLSRRDPGDGRQKVVGLYAARVPARFGQRLEVRCKRKLRSLFLRGIACPYRRGPGNNGVRRWARGADETHIEHPEPAQSSLGRLLSRSFKERASRRFQLTLRSPRLRGRGASCL